MGPPRRRTLWGISLLLTLFARKIIEKTIVIKNKNYHTIYIYQHAYHIGYDDSNKCIYCIFRERGEI